MAKKAKTTKKSTAKKTATRKKKTAKKKTAKKKPADKSVPEIRTHKDLVHNIGDLAAEFTTVHKEAEAVLGGSSLLDSVVDRHIPTSCPNFDAMLQGGFPCRRITQIFGNESTAKSTLVQSAMIECTKMGGVSILFDPELSFDPDRYRRMGGDPDTVILIQKEYMPKKKGQKKDPGLPSLTVQDVFRYIHDILTSIAIKPQWQGRPVFVALDSLDNITTDEALAGAKDGMANKPRLIREGFRQITSPVAQLGACFVIVSQTIENIGGYGAKLVTSGGGGPKFISSVRISMKKFYYGDNDFYTRRTIQGTDKKEFTGQLLVEATVVKNKLNRPYTSSVTAINNDSDQNYEGVDSDFSLLYGLGPNNLVTKSGQAYRYIRVTADTPELKELAESLGLVIDQEYPFLMGDWRAWVNKYPAIRTYLEALMQHTYRRPDIFVPDEPAEEVPDAESGQETNTD
jgi:recombination protein RecA